MMTYLYFMKFSMCRCPLYSEGFRVLFSTFQAVCKSTYTKPPFLSIKSNLSLLNLSSMELGLCSFIRTSSNYFRPVDFNVQSLWNDDEMATKSKTMPSNVFNPKTASYKQEHLLKAKLMDLAMIKSVNQINEEWKTIKSSILDMFGTINEENIDAVILNQCSVIQSLPLGKSYFKYLRSTQKQMNRATYGNYLYLFYACSSNCTDDDLKEIDIIYRELEQVYPVLDTYTAEKVVCALSITKNWQEYEKLFKDIKLFYHPTPYVYSVVIKTAFKNNEFSLGWKLMEELLLQQKIIHDDVFIFYLEIVKQNKNEKITRVLQFLHNFNVKPSVRLCEVLKQTFEEYNNKKGMFTTISKRGQCNNCHSKLEPAWVSQEDYDQLKTTFLNPVLVGKDIFQKTQPQEFDEFLKFLEKTAPFDVVLDGLNIALKVHKSKKSVKVSAFQLKSVVKHFVAQDKKILVLGRKHMANWVTTDMQYVYDYADVFLAEDISEDDPFFIYAALYSGLGTCIVSQDMMRGHKFLLANPKVQATFQKWQAQHQYFINFIEDNGTVHLKEPVSFMQSIQQNSRGDWHIPCLVKENLTSKTQVDNFHRHWLCLTNRVTPLATTHYNKQREYSYDKKKNLESRSFNNKGERYRTIK